MSWSLINERVARNNIWCVRLERGKDAVQYTGIHAEWYCGTGPVDTKVKVTTKKPTKVTTTSFPKELSATCWAELGIGRHSLMCFLL